MTLNPSRFALDEVTNQNWTITVEEGVSMDDVLKTDFLADVASRLRPYDRLRIRCDTGEFYAEVLVVACGRAWAKLVPIFHVDLEAKDLDEEQGEAFDQYKVMFRGPHLKFCVIRKSDNEPIKEQCANKAEAQAWLSSHLLTL